MNRKQGRDELRPLALNLGGGFAYLILKTLRVVTDGGERRLG